MKKSLTVLFVSLALLFGFMPNLMAEEGVTDTEIHIGQWGPQTGPAAAWGAVARGTGDYFKWINENGGINGRKIVYHMFDDGYNPAKTKAGVKELQEGTGIFAWVAGVGTSPGLAVKDYLMEKKVPWIGPSAGSMHWVSPPEKYLFAIYPLYFYEAKTLVKYAVETLKKKKIAIAYLNDEYGKNGLDGAVEALKAHGLELVAKVPVEAAEEDLKPHVMELKKAEADTVLLWTTVSHSVRIVGTSKAMGFAPQFMGSSTTSDFMFMNYISKGLYEGVICPTFGPVATSDHPLIVKYKKEIFDKYASKEERWGQFYSAGITYAEPLIEGIKRVGKDLTREKFVTQMEGIKGFQSLGPEINFKPYDKNDIYSRQGTQSSFLIQALPNGETKTLTDWIKME
ncbi:MAG: ABC transporter substrate-binding protein [Desulfobacula sp.]|jgi:ABC-type branched-subunit amino acid transport system substrate-binding protein